jgi:predicted ABC-type transport system involved in lysophospholipase L1 biosynthesis ATPase subunit
MNHTNARSCVLRARGLRKDHGRDASLVHAVNGVELDVTRWETVAVMGPSRLREVDVAVHAGLAGPA